MVLTENLVVTDWARIPAEHDHGFGARTHGVAVLRDGRIAVLAQADPALHIFDSEGRLIECWGSGLGGAHGLTSVVQDGVETLWITDQISGHVGEYSLSGQLLQTIEAPPGPQPYSPTQVAVAPNTRDVWVADGYGSNVIRRHNSSGQLIAILTGEGSPACFARPHGMAFAEDGTLYVADRRNRRMIAYDEEGKYRFHVDGVAHSPCGFALVSERLYVPELFGGLKIFNRSLELLEEIGSNIVQRPVVGWEGQSDWGWPTLHGWPDQVNRHEASDRWIAPHDAAVSSDGTIYLVEWVAGGRISRISSDSPFSQFLSTGHAVEGSQSLEH
jgi:hypothetical protein